MLKVFNIVIYKQLNPAGAGERYDTRILQEDLLWPGTAFLLLPSICLSLGN